jgi:capsular exopolysaccharide synthesis family protein
MARRRVPPADDDYERPGDDEPARGRSAMMGGPERSHALDYLRVLSKRRWTALAAFVLTIAAAVVYTWTVTPVYEARVQLMIEDERPRVVVFKDAIDQDRDKIDYQQTQVAILQSRGLARRTIAAQSLWNNPEFTGAELKGQGLVGRWAGSVTGAVAGAVAALSKSAPVTAAAPRTPAPSTGVAETAMEARIVDAFLGNLTVAAVRNSRMVVVKFTSQNPQLAANVANALTDAYTKQNLEFKSLNASEAAEWLGSQLEEQRKKVEASQTALQRYREQTESVSTDSRENTVMQKLNELNTAVTHAKTERILKEAAYRRVQALQDTQANLDAVPAILGNGFIQTLKTQLSDLLRQQAQLRRTLGDRHPEMLKLQESIDAAQTRLRGEVAKVVDGLRHDFLAAEAEEQGLGAAVEAQKREALVMRRKQIEYDTLEHSAASDRQIFETLLQRTKETGVSGQGLGSNIRVIDTADIPRSPISPKKERNLFLAFVGGTMLAVGLAFFVDYLDKSIQTPDEVKEHLGLTCLGLVPTTKDTPGSEGLLMSNGVPPRFKESFRMLRTNVLFASSKEPLRTILVTSTGPNEGKTVVATNLAIALAQTGQQVVLVDGDMRRPSIHKALLAHQEPGLSEAVTSGLLAPGIVQATAIPGLSILSSGATPPNPSELLSSPHLKELLNALTEQYAWVVIDSPPVMAVTDASLIANVVGGVLFVVAAEKTLAPIAMNALEQLEGASAWFVGAVLNRVDLERNAFFYSSYYRHEYSQYYGHPRDDRF